VVAGDVFGYDGRVNIACKHRFRERYMKFIKEDYPEEYESEELRELRSLVYRCEDCMKEYAEIVAEDAVFTTYFWDFTRGSYSLDELIRFSEENCLSVGIRNRKIEKYIYEAFLKELAEYGCPGQYE